jgi:hypothetical protein
MWLKCGATVGKPTGKKWFKRWDRGRMLRRAKQSFVIDNG